MTLQIDSLYQGTGESFNSEQSEELLMQLLENEIEQAERAAMIDEMLGDTPEKNRNALVREIDTLAQLYEGRAIEGTHGDGTRVMYFATRRTGLNETFLDDIYTIKESPDGKASLQVDFMTLGTQGYRLVVPPSGRVQAMMFIGETEHEFVPGSKRERECLHDFVDLSLKTAQIVRDRQVNDPTAARAADAETRFMTEAYLEAKNRR